MDRIIDFRAEHDKRHGPDAEHVYVDGEGQKWFRFTIDYKDGDRTFSFDLWATSWDDAKRRLDLIKQNAHVEGQIYSRIPG